MHTHRHLPCLSPKSSARLHGGQIVVVIVVLVLGGALAWAGVPVILTAEMLTTCGLIGVHLARRSVPAAETR